MHLLLFIGHALRLLLIVLTLAEVLPQALLVILLLIGKLFRLIGDIGHFRSGLLIAHRLDALLRLFEPVGRALSFRLSGRAALLALLTGLARGGGTAHIARRLFQIANGVIELLLLTAAQRIITRQARLLLLLLTLLLLTALLLAALRGLLSGLLTRLARLLPLLPRLSGLLSALSRLLALLLALLPLLTRLALLALLHLLHVAFQLLRFTAQHFLLPALLRQLLGIVLLLLGEFLLTPCEVGQLLHRVVDFLLLLLGLRSATATVVFVLILVLIEFEVEEVGKIAARAATASAAPTAAAADLNLNIAEGRFGAQQVLQCLLFRCERVLECQALELVRCRRHGRHRGFHFLHELLEGRAVGVELTSLGAVRHRSRLLAQF